MCLPANCQPWLLTQPDSIMDHHTLWWDFTKAPRLMWYSKAPYHLPLHNQASRNWLASRIEKPPTDLVKAISEEFRRSLGQNAEALTCTALHGC